ncbi:MAG: hypothetical protein Q8N23_01685 [Archangium sp.]|nr:hypothetical protein [Archangium sp.]
MKRLLILSACFFAGCGTSMGMITQDAGQPDASVGGGSGGGAATGGGGGTATGGGTASDGGAVELNGGNTCATAPDVTAGGVFTGTTDAADAGITDDYGPSVGSCPSGGAASGRDVAYAITAAVTTSYTVTVTPLTGSFDPLLYAQLSCGTNACIAGTTLNGPGQAETITFSAPAGQTVYVIVDGELASKGPFEISIQP